MNLYIAALLASAAASCWSSNAGHSFVANPCVEAGDRLRVRICRRHDAVEWTVSNRTHTALWAFVAPPAGPTGSLDRANAVAMMSDGKLLLRKFHLPSVWGEAVVVGAVLLSPGASDSGRVPLGARLNERAANFVGAIAKGTNVIATVALEIGFAEQRSSDQQDAMPERDGLLFLPNFNRSHQQFARSPELPWR